MTNIKMFIKTLLSKIKVYSDVFLTIKRCPLILNRNYYHNMIQNKYRNLYYTKKLSTKQIDSRNSSSDITYSSDSDKEVETESDFIELDEDDRGNSVNIRNLLYPNNKDQIILELNECASIQQVFNVIDRNESSLNEIHVTQAILVLWDLQKCFYKHNIYHQSETNINKMLKSNNVMINYMQQVTQHDDFKKLIKLIEAKYNNFTLDALTCNLLYLNRIGVNVSENVMQLMFNRCEKEIENHNEHFPLTALSRFTVTVFSDPGDFWSILITKDIMPIIISRLRTCNSIEDFKLLTICLNKMYQIVTKDTMILYKRVAENLLINNKISSNDHRTVLKVLKFLNRPYWSDYNVPLIRKYVYALKDNIDKLRNPELIQLYKVFQTTKEPADMLIEIQECASNRLSEIEESDYNLETTLDLLSCVVSFSSPLQRPKFEKLAQHYVNNSLTPPSLSSMHKILYHIKTEDKKLCNKFWDKVLENINLEESDLRIKKILNLCHKYMHFYTDVGNKYRYYDFENRIIKMLLEELENGFSGLITHQFSRIAAFIIAYNSDIEVLNIITNKIMRIRHFSPIDCLNLSKGLQIAEENVKFKHINNIQKYYNDITSVLNECIRNEILVKKNVELQNINILARGFIYRKGDINSEAFQLLLNSVITSKNEFNSHIIKDLSFFLQINNCLIPEIINRMVEYIIENNNSILGNTVDKLLYLCYYFGYTPNNEFFNIASDLIIRDKERFSGLVFVQASLALCFYHKLPENLIKHIFSVDFLEKIDEELSNCYSKTTYPVRVRSLIMQLNRAVCLDYPETNVPWFHQKYIESRNITTKKNYFHGKVLSTLEDVIDDQSCISQDVLTPYGYHLDIELNLDKESSVPRKIAFLIVNQNAYSAINKNLKGVFQLKKRHLEILGYDVFYENSYDWKDFYTHDQSISYIKNKIWPKQKCIKNII